MKEIIRYNLSKSKRYITILCWKLQSILKINHKTSLQLGGVFQLRDLNDLWCKKEHFPHIDLEILRSPS